MKRNTKIALGILGGAAALGGGYFLYRKLNTTVAGDGMGADEYDQEPPASGIGDGFMLTVCKPYGAQCDPALGDAQCCQSGGHWTGFPVQCLKGPKGEMPYRCRQSGTTGAKILGEGSVGPGAQGGGNVKIVVKSPRYLMTWYDMGGHATISDLDIIQGGDLIDAVVAAGGGEADIPRCTKYPGMRFALYPTNPAMYSSSAAFSAMLNARNHGYEDYLWEHAFKVAEIESSGPAQKYVMFKDLWPGPYWLFELDHRNKAFQTVKIGVENFGSSLGDVLGNMYEAMSAYLGGNMDWSQITVRRSCNFYPWYVTVQPGTGRMGTVATYTYQPYYHYAFHEGDVDGMEWLQDAANDMGEYVSEKIDQIIGSEFGI